MKTFLEIILLLLACWLIEFLIKVEQGKYTIGMAPHAIAGFAMGVLTICLLVLIAKELERRKVKSRRVPNDDKGNESI
jgi:hypothetical protein